MASIDRRGFLLGAAAAAAAGVGWGGRVPAAAAGPCALTARRAATFRSLVRLLRAAPHGRFRVLGVTATERRFGCWYAGQDAAARARADAVLDAVGAPVVASYERTAQDVAECRSAAAAPRAAALAAAVDLVGVVCEPLPAEDERPSAFALELRR